MDGILEPARIAAEPDDFYADLLERERLLAHERLSKEKDRQFDTVQFSLQAFFFK